VGVDGVLDALAGHKTYLDSTGKGQWRWEHRVQHDVLNRLRDLLLQKALDQLQPDQLNHLLKAVAQRELHPMDAAKLLLSS
jgi:putative protein kinase ArgK-like GTPase of G3E family